jgi:hypothetical protein
MIATLDRLVDGTTVEQLVAEHWPAPSRRSGVGEGCVG